MLEIVIMTAAPVLMSLCALLYINYGEIKSRSGFKNKLSELLSFKKHKLGLLLLTALGIGLTFLSHRYFGDRLEISLKLLFIYELLICVAYVDYKKQIIPNKLMIFAFFSYFVFFAYEVLVLDYEVLELLKLAGLGLALGGGVFALCGFLSKGSMGMGDIKLFAVLGILLGWRGVFNIIFFLALYIGGYGIFEIIRGRKNKKSVIPAGPFALLSMITAMCLGIGGLM